MNAKRWGRPIAFLAPALSEVGIRGRWLWPALACLMLIGIAGGAIYFRIIQADVPLFWDEQVHALAGLQLASDLARGDLLSMAWDTYSAIYYPPAFYWLEALAFILLGPSRMAARLVSLVAFAVLGLLLVGAGRRLRADRNPWVGVIAFSFVAVSIPLAEVIGQAMLEGAGLMMLVAVLWAYFHAGERDGWRQWAGVGLLVILTYLTRAHYGLLLLGSILLNEVIHLGVNAWGRTAFPEVRALKPLFAFSVPVVVFALLWLSGGSRVHIAIMAVYTNAYLDPRVADRFSLDALLFFPRSLGILAGSWWGLRSWLLVGL